MLAELGHYSLILGLLTAALLMVMPWVGVVRGSTVLQRMARPLAAIQLLFMAIAFGILIALFLGDDFSVQYVQQNSNSRLPWYFKVSAVWGAHEGSLLLWALVLSCWTAAVACFSRKMPDAFVARVLVVIGAVSVAFAAFLIFTSNPFLRVVPAYADGNDLNPLLQHFGLIIHPPLLYIGYIGFVVAFAFAVAGLWSGRLDAVWARWSRPWTTLAWAFLTLGIMLGSWWAYTEVGWGGWWFWDPVENASFMPWIMGTALIHSLAVTEKRGLFKHWTILLSLMTFGLSILGTLLVRSGAISSVHTFSVDPDRGAFILAIFVIFMALGLCLYVVRAKSIKDSATFNLGCREGLMLLNNVLLMAACAVVMIGTITPLAMLVAGYKSHEILSFGKPFYNAGFTIIMLPLLFVIGFGVMFRWKKDSVSRVVVLAGILALAAIVVGLSIFATQYTRGAVEDFPAAALAAVVLGAWAFITAWLDIARQFKHRFAPFKIPASQWGMAFAHTGFAVTVIGIAMTSSFSEKVDRNMLVGQRVAVAGYEVQLLGVQRQAGPNFTADVAKVEITKNGKRVAVVEPEIRHYTVRGESMREAGIDVGVFRDMHVLLAGRAYGAVWMVHVQYKPYIRWIWFGCIIMALGGIFAVADRRYRRINVVKG